MAFPDNYTEWGGTAADFTTSAYTVADGVAVIRARANKVTVWDGPADDATQITDLYNHDQAPVTELVSAASGLLESFWVPDTYTALWVSIEGSDRVELIPPTGVGVEWPNILDKPATFPPAPHSHTSADITDLPEQIVAGTADKVSKGELVYNVKDFGAVGDGATDDTAAIRSALDFIAFTGRGATLYFPPGNYRVTRILHPSQPTPHSMLAADLTIFKVPAGVTLLGAGMGATKISLEYGNLTAAANSSSMAVFVHDDDFEASGIHFHGNYDPGTWAFFSTNNNNSLFSPIRIELFRQNIHDCRITNLPGFSVGTASIRGARFLNNYVEKTANGYNVNGSDILVDGNTFWMAEGIESAGNTQTGDGKWGGRISVEGNTFYDCNGCASLGGNAGTGSANDSYNYIFANNLVIGDTVSQYGVTIGPNAHTFAVTGNTFRGYYTYGVGMTLGGGADTLTPSDGVISGNTFDHLLSATTHASLDLVAILGKVLVANNVILEADGNGQVAMQFAGSSTAEFILVGNYMRARYAYAVTTGASPVVRYSPTNIFASNDTTPRLNPIGTSANYTEAISVPATHRVPLAGLSADVLEFAGRLKGGTETNAAQAVHKRWYSGKYEWGPTTGAAAVDTSLERLAVGVLGVGAGHCLRTGRAVTGSRPDPAVVGAGAFFYDTTLGRPIWSDGTSWKASVDDATLTTALTTKKTDSMATGKLLGRSTAGTGVIEELTIGSGLSLIAGTLTSSGGGGSSIGPQMLPAGALAANAPRWAVSASTHAAPTSGRLALHAIWLEAGTTVTNISFMSGTTAGATLTHTWFSLYDSSRALLGVTSDDTSATWAASTVKTLAMSSPVVISSSGFYYLGVTVVGTTIPTFVGSASEPFAVAAIAPCTNGWSTAGLTTPGTAPNPAANPSLATITGWAWGWVS